MTQSPSRLGSVHHLQTVASQN